MSLSSISSSVQGIQQGLAQFAKSAGQIADPTTGVDASAIVALEVAEQTIQANAKVAQQVSRMSQQLIDVLA
jgi:hypothetical protein